MSKNNETAAVTPPASPKFSIERLRADCYALFGITPSTFDGATFGLSGEYTPDEMRGIISKWQKGKVKPNGRR